MMKDEYDFYPEYALPKKVTKMVMITPEELDNLRAELAAARELQNELAELREYHDKMYLAQLDVEAKYQKENAALRKENEALRRVEQAARVFLNRPQDVEDNCDCLLCTALRSLDAGKEE
jgi:hypothetical protein